MKKIFGVVFVGGLLLALSLYLVSRAREVEVVSASASVAPTASSSPLPPAPAVSPDRVACERMATLCTTATQSIDVAECERQFADTRRLAGTSGVEKSEACLGDATSCAAASGCISGGVGMSALGEAMKGFGTALSK